jgi:hypothetical protein
MDAYADFIDEVSAGGFGAPADGGWTAEQVAANVVYSHEELISVTEAVLVGDKVSYDDRERTDLRELDRYVAEYGGLRGLADRLAETVTVLRDLAGQLAERANTLVPVRIVEAGEVIVDQPLPWGKLLELDEEVYVPRRLEQLRALRRLPGLRSHREGRGNPE